MEEKEVWYECPKCSKRILKYKKQTAKSKELYIKCKRCKEIIEIKID